MIRLRITAFCCQLLPLLVTALVIAGCATINKVFPDPVEEDKTFVLASDPQSSGLLIVSVDVFLDPSFDIFSDNVVDEGFSRLFGTTKKTGYIEGLKIRDENGQEFSSRLFIIDKSNYYGPESMFIVFDGLPEGVYRLSAASAEFGLSNEERKEYFDCEYINTDDTYGTKYRQEYENSNCPYRAYVSFGIEDGADSAVGPIQVYNGQAEYVGLLTIMENHRLADYGVERRKIHDKWQDVLVHGHSIEKILKSEPREGAEEKIVHALASDNRESGWGTVLQERDKQNSE